MTKPTEQNHRPKNTRWYWLASLALLITTAQTAELLNDIHIDHAFRYNSATDEWEIVIQGNDGEDDLIPDEAVMIVYDQPFPSAGGRASRPEDEAWDFIGVDANEDLWLIPQAFSPFLWPGWRSSGAFAEYFNNDPRLGFTDTFVKISLEDVTYSGSGDGHFSAWEFVGGEPQQWIASSDGITGDDAFYFSSGHAHTNMGFSDPGVYRVDYSASAFLNNDGANPPAGTNPVSSQVQSFYYAVGTFAEWKATHYEPHELVDDNPSDSIPEVAHVDSDTDKDGVNLLLEYAFNLVPVQSDTKSMVPETGTEGLPVGYIDNSGEDPMLVLEYVRRRAEGSPGITYFPEFSSNVDSGWVDASSETTVPIDATWERVKAVDPVDADEHPARFGRVRVELE